VRLILPFALIAIFVLAGAMMRLTTGDVVPIADSRSDPQRARIDTRWFNHRWRLGGCIVALTLMFGALLRGQAGSPN